MPCCPSNSGHSLHLHKCLVSCSIMQHLTRWPLPRCQAFSLMSSGTSLAPASSVFGHRQPPPLHTSQTRPDLVPSPPPM